MNLADFVAKLSTGYFPPVERLAVALVRAMMDKIGVEPIVSIFNLEFMINILF